MTARCWLANQSPVPTYILTLIAALQPDIEMHSCAVDSEMTIDQFAICVKYLPSQCFDVVDGLVSFAKIARDSLVAQSSAIARKQFRENCQQT